MNKIITISRQLWYSYYDSKIITLLAKETNMSEEYIKNISEKGIYPYAFQFAKSFAMYGAMQNVQKGKCYYCW